MSASEYFLEKTIPQRLSALVVERDPANSELATGRLRRLGYDVTVCADGHAVVDWCITRGLRFELLLIGIDWPIHDSLAAIAHLRAHPLTREMPILVVSSLSPVELHNLGHGGDYLRKPYSRRELETAVHEARRQRIGT